MFCTVFLDCESLDEPEVFKPDWSYVKCASCGEQTLKTYEETGEDQSHVMTTPLALHSAHRVSLFRASGLNVGSVETWWKGRTLEYTPGCLHRPCRQSCHNAGFRGNRSGLIGPGLSGSGPEWAQCGADHQRGSHNSAANELSLSPHSTAQSWGGTPSGSPTLFNVSEES